MIAPKLTTEKLEDLLRLSRAIARADFEVDRMLKAVSSHSGLPLGATITAAPFTVDLPAGVSREIIDRVCRRASAMLEEGRSILREHGVVPPFPMPTDAGTGDTVDLVHLAGLIGKLRQKPDAKWSDADVAAMRERNAAPTSISRLRGFPSDPLHEPEHDAPGLAPPIARND